MAELTTVGIARAWANAFRTDRTLIHWGQEHYGRPFSVSIGADMRRPPEEGDAPFLALFPDAVETGRGTEPQPAQPGHCRGHC